MVQIGNVYMWLAGILSGIIGAMGIGGGGVLIIYLTLMAGVDQITAQGINLLFFIPCAVIALVIHSRKKLIIWRLALPMILGGLVGVAIGAYSAEMIGPNMLGKIFSAFLIFIGLRELFARRKEDDGIKKSSR
ncbi:MAG: sulfite exporter TauE/SafE family protein [Clostridia bacterium]|nr:sulfite exporter TauE/SafE family protein [Clostridia bacterium]